MREREGTGDDDEKDKDKQGGGISLGYAKRWKGDDIEFETLGPPRDEHEGGLLCKVVD